MNQRQDWHTEFYKGMEVHVTAIPREDALHRWDYTVRVAQPGDDSTSESELVAESGDEHDYPSEKAAIEAGFAKGYAMVDHLVE